MKKDIRQLRAALLDLIGVLNRPQPDAALIEEAGVDLERALFPLMLRVDKFGPVGVVELAELCGRDYTTVSRQVSRLEEVGLVMRVADAKDKRVRAVALTVSGRSMTRALDEARQKLYERLLKNWSDADIKTFSRLLRRAADQAVAWSQSLK